MRVQQLDQPDGLPSYTVVDDVGLPIVPIDQYLAYLTARGSSPNTVRSYAFDLRDFWTFLDQRDQSVLAVSVDDLAAWISWLRLPESLRVGGGSITPLDPEPHLAPSTISRKLSAVVAFYEFLGQRDTEVLPLLSQLRQGQPRGMGRYQPFLSHLAKSRTRPSRSIAVKVAARRPSTLNPDQVQSVLEACTNRRDRLFFGTLWETGVRASEALGLRIDDLDERHGTLRITPRENANGARVKGSKERVVPVGRRFVRLAIDYLTLDYGAINSDYLFVNLYGGSIGRPWTYDSVDDLVRRTRTKVDFYFTPHMFRHTYSTRLLQAGARIEIVSELLGHADIQTTRSIYGHLNVSDLRAELDRVGWLDDSAVKL
ncbi:MAG: tyrosine-type recombinase/integrase [Acidimicrobiales bacterium]